MFFNGWNESLVKEGLAYVPQSAVADLVNLAIIRLHDKLKCRSDIQLLLQVHDSIVAQAKDGVVEEAIALIRQEMTIPIQINGRTLVIPCDVKAGKNWEEMRKPT
jgi:DNA polymerase-1